MSNQALEPNSPQSPPDAGDAGDPRLRHPATDEREALQRAYEGDLPPATIETLLGYLDDLSDLP